MNYRDLLNAAWAVLQRPSRQAFSSFTLDERNLSRAGLDRDGLKHILIGSKDAHHVPRFEGALSIQPSELAFAGDVRTYIDVSCADPSLDSQFTEVAVDLLSEVDGRDENAALVLEVVERWRQLFRLRWTRVSERERIGLFAELSALNALRLAGVAQISDWVGPTGAPHDFELPKCCIEVKGIGHETRQLRINGLDQLQPHNDRQLSLLIIRVSQSEDGVTLPELCSQIASDLRMRSLLRERLQMLGLDLDHPDLATYTYALTSVFEIPVASSTPRITKEYLDPAFRSMIGDVTYSIELRPLLALGNPVPVVEFSKGGWSP